MVVSVIKCLLSNTVELKEKILKIKSQHTQTLWVYDNISHIGLFLPLHRCCVHLLWLFSSLSFSSHPPSSSCPFQARCRPARPGHAARRSGPTSSSRPSGPESDRGTSHKNTESKWHANNLGERYINSKYNTLHWENRACFRNVFALWHYFHEN